MQKQFRLLHVWLFKQETETMFCPSNSTHGIYRSSSPHRRTTSCLSIFRKTRKELLLSSWPEIPPGRMNGLVTPVYRVGSRVERQAQFALPATRRFPADLRVVV